jgi:hypothetical protein
MPLFRYQNRPESEARLIHIGEVFGRQDDALLRREHQDQPENADKDKKEKSDDKKQETDELHRSAETHEQFEAQVARMRQSRVDTASRDTGASAARITETNRQVARLEAQSRAANANADMFVEGAMGPGAVMASADTLHTQNPEARAVAVNGRNAPAPDARVESGRVEAGRAA